MLATLLELTAGTASVAGYHIDSDRESVRRNVGYLTGDTALNRLSPREVLTYFELHGMSPAC